MIWSPLLALLAAGTAPGLRSALVPAGGLPPTLEPQEEPRLQDEPVRLLLQETRQEQEAALELQVPVQGLDESTAPTVERALRELVDRSDPPESILLAARIDVEAGRMDLSVAPGKTLRLSQMEKCLAGVRGRIQRQRLRFAEGRCLLESHVDDDLGPRIRAALLEGALYQRVEVRPVSDSPRYRVELHGGSEEATVAAIANVLESISPALTLEDLSWTAPEAKPPEASRLPRLAMTRAMTRAMTPARFPADPD